MCCTIFHVLISKMQTYTIKNQLSRKTSIIFLTQKNSSTYTNGGETKMKPKQKFKYSERTSILSVLLQIPLLCYFGIQPKSFPISTNTQRFDWECRKLEMQM